MEQAERASASISAPGTSAPTGAGIVTTEGVTRSQQVVYTLPRTTEALTQLLSPALERIDAAQPGVQLVIVTADAETAVIISDLVYRLAGPQGIEVVPVTSANRAARLMVDRPIHAVAGPATELQTLMQRSILKLADAKTVVLAWADDIVTSGPEGVAALEVLFGELPKETARAIVARQITPEVEQIVERYARTARRIAAAPDAESAEGTVPTLIQYLVVSATARASALRRLLDDIDPPSAAIIVRTDRSREEASQALAQLGYRRGNDPVRVVDGAVAEGTHTIILFDAPVTRAELANVADSAVNTIALLTPQELEPLRGLAGSLTPFTLSGPAASVRRQDRILRDQLSAILTDGIASRELTALEPLLERYDGVEIAAAAIRLLERDRAKAQAAPRPAAAPKPPREARATEPSSAREPERGGDHPPKREFNDRPKRDFGDQPRRDFSDRPKRDFSDRGDRPKRDFGDRPKRDFGDRPKRDFNDRPKRDYGDQPRRDFSDRPKRDFGDRPSGNFAGKPKRDFGSKPKRDFGGEHRKGNFGRGSRDR